VQIAEKEKPLEKKTVKEIKILAAAPRYSENSPPSYPSIARRRGYEGVVMLSVKVLVDGNVGELRIKGTSGHSILDRAAVKAVKKWKFKPAFRGEVPVPMWVEVPVRFVIK
ncbi:MAG: energy transducer TonB, partial [Pseudomonadota bacterium]